MEPRVLVGGGEYHYRLIQSMQQLSQPLILVSQNIKVLAQEALPVLLKGGACLEDLQWDLWKACQRKKIYFLEDECLSIQREEGTLHLKRFGRLGFSKLSVEPSAVPTLQGRDLSGLAAVMLMHQPFEFLRKMEQFIAEVHRHCPREVRVVFSGFNTQSVRLALAIKQRLVGGCETADLVILDDETLPTQQLFKSRKQKEMERLKREGIRVLSGALVHQFREHWIQLHNGTEISHDILIPVDHWRSEQGLGKILQFDQQKILVGRDLVEVRGAPIFVVGPQVQFEKSQQKVSEINKQEVVHVLRHNLFAEADEPSLECRDRMDFDECHWSKNWSDKTQKQLLALQEVTLNPASEDKRWADLTYQAQHMSRPWQGLIQRFQESEKNTYRLHSFNGFNCWGSYALSALKITEIALLKSLTRGIEPEQLRFNLTLPKDEQHLLNHVFESTFRAIESVADRLGVEIAGGDTFDGRHWHLNVTIGGRVFMTSESKFQPHDYLVMTRPLGFGFLWAGRLSSPFNSSWIRESIKDPLLSDRDKMKDFLLRWQPSGRVLIEEWGFLFHCLQQLPAHQQLMVNFREVPRWNGADQLIGEKVTYPGLDTNWSRIEQDVAFSRDEVSLNNAVLWDSMSQGSLVFGVKAQGYQQVLDDLRRMGYERAALVGCIRPKVKGNRVVLSDWSPK